MLRRGKKMSSSSSSYDSNPFLHANIFSRFFHHWVSPLLKKSRKNGVLHLNDLYDLPPHLYSTELTDKLEKNWFDEVKRCPNNPSLIRVTLRTVGWKPFAQSILLFLNGLLQIIQPLILTVLMGFFEPCSSMPSWHAWLLAFATIIAALTSSLIVNEYVHRIDIYAMQIFIAYTGLIYRKVLRLSLYSMNSITSGEITNLLANDANQVQFVAVFMNHLWIAPIQVILVIFVFWYFVKYIAFIAIGYTVFLLLIQPLYSRMFVSIRTKILQITDERLKIMSEIIKSMRIVKMYCWETAFIQKICLIRKREIIQYTFYAICDCIQLIFSYNYTTLIFLMMYGTMWSLNIRLDTRFFAISSCLLGFMRVYCIDFFSNAIRDLSNYLVARKRIEKFLLLDECERDTRLLSSSHLEISSSNKIEIINNITQGVQVKCNLKEAHWEKNGLFKLQNIIFDAHPGDLICIIGAVGSGKSSLLQTLTGEIGFFEGKVRLHGSFCYVPQEAWIFSSTLKNNILFGKEYNHKLFQRVIQATALDTDLDQLSQGVNTLVGDQGVMLSGGQKARVNLARALYRNADIYLLDDPLSAVDVKVSKHLFEKSIQHYLCDKICILVTHQIQFLQDATKIIVLDQGKMIQMGTYNELISSSSSFAHLLEDINQQEQQQIAANIQQQQSIISSIYSEKEDEDEVMSNIDTKQQGAIKWTVYTSYIKAGLGCVFGSFFILFLLTAYQATFMYSSWWIATWSDDESHRYRNYNQCISTTIENRSHLYLMSENEWNIYRNQKFYSYCGIIILLLILTFLRTFALELMCLNAGRVLHNKMFRRVIRCPIAFFDTNPIGRILNHFTRDILIMDTDIVMDVPDFLNCLSAVLGTVILIGLLNPWAFIPAFIGIIGMLIVRYRFARCFRDLRRITEITRSPLYSYLSSTIHGLKVIRSYHAEQMCSQQFLSYLDQNIRADYLTKVVERWAAIRFDWTSFTFLALVTLCSMLVRIYKQELSTADIALTLSYSLNLMGLFQWTIRQSVTVETHMTAVERILEYCSLEQEPSVQLSLNNRLSNNWPSHGQIVFRNVSMSYSNDDKTSLVLRNITLTIQSEEKIGIVGRTGAGKSSLIQVLFRMGLLVNGQIEIDNIDISTIPLDDLRSRISIIPQDPVLFTGTIRNNLDQFDNYTDQQIWNALDQVQLKTLVNDTMSNGLDSLVSENGCNLSVGQKQLICLARAILKQSKILVIDEATANVDNATDELIQQAIRDKFKECTVLTIAHRLRTIIDSDRILVLGNGEVLEFDTPSSLLANSNSYFVSLVEQTGLNEAEYLRTLANRTNTKMKSVTQKTISDDDDIIPIMNENDPLLV
ncbi:unnamed protein product [Adineta steineri]|uniref:Multidrug resistance-associated protein 4-like n=1 Tax=Adineta steineri TaxID=433720 RepID=A0A819V170_9BILA|nr:unnamed protein product [Adineta steineri]